MELITGCFLFSSTVCRENKAANNIGIKVAEPSAKEMVLQVPCEIFHLEQSFQNTFDLNKTIHIFILLSLFCFPLFIESSD